MRSAALARLKPMNLYGWSKHLFDLAVIDRGAQGRQAAAAMGGAEVLQRVRPERIPQGRDDEPRRQEVRRCQGRQAGRLFKSHRAGIGDGEQRRDFIYVDDAVSVVRWLIDTPKVNGIFNVGTGQAESFRDLITAVFAALGRAPDIEYVDMPASIRDSYQYFTQAGRKSAPRRL